jgi:hypothetical protein
VSILKPNASDSNKPLNDEMKKKLSVNQPGLIRQMTLRHGLLADLVAEDCITWRHKELIENASSRTQSNSRLLDIIMRGSQSDFHKFVVCLINSGQQHVCRILLEDGVVARLVARCSRSNQSTARMCLYSRTVRNIPRVDRGNVKQDEAYIVKQFRRLLNRCSPERRTELISQVVNIDDDVQLIDIDKDSSIGLYYWCTSLKGLQYMTELYASGQLQIMLNQAFAALLGASQSLLIDTLSWDRLEFLKCSQYMYELMGMSVFSGVYSLAQGKKIMKSIPMILHLRSDNFHASLQK